MPLVLFDDVLDHVLRIDRIYRQNQGASRVLQLFAVSSLSLHIFICICI